MSHCSRWLPAPLEQSSGWKIRSEALCALGKLEVQVFRYADILGGNFWCPILASPHIYKNTKILYGNVYSLGLGATFRRAATNIRKMCAWLHTTPSPLSYPDIPPFLFGWYFRAVWAVIKDKTKNVMVISECSPLQWEAVKALVTGPESGSAYQRNDFSQPRLLLFLLLGLCCKNFYIS